MIFQKVASPPVVIGMDDFSASYGPLSGLTVNGVPVTGRARVPWQVAWRAGRGELETGSLVVQWEPACDLASALSDFPAAVATLSWVSDHTAWVAEDPRAKRALARTLCGVLAAHVPAHQDLLSRVASWQETREDRRAVSAAVAAPRAPRDEVLCLVGDALGSFDPAPASYWAGLKRLAPLVRTPELATALALAWQATPQLEEGARP